MGGLGLFEIGEYVTSLQATWIKRVMLRSHDNWRNDVRHLTHGNPLVLNSNSIIKNRNPVIYNIARSWETFCKAFYKNNNNLLKAFILNNPAITRNRVDRGLLDINFFRQRNPIETEKLANIRVSDLLSEGTIKPLPAINQSLNIQLTVTTYMRLSLAITESINNIKRVNNDGTSTKVENFLARFKKGSRNIRNILENDRLERKAGVKTKVVNNFLKVVGIADPEIDNKALCIFVGGWNDSCLPSRIKDFLFKFNSNKLPVNTRLTHMAPNAEIDRACTFCKLSRTLPAPEETFVHLFWDCPSTKTLIYRFFEKNFPEIMNESENCKKLFWLTGISTISQRLHNISRIAHLYCIWNLHTKRKLSSWQTLKINADFEL